MTNPYLQTVPLSSAPEVVPDTMPARPEPPADSPAGLVPLDAVLCTAELTRRPARRPDHEAENRALTLLVQALADSPGTIHQTLADTLLDAFQAGSAGISLLTKDARSFYWPAVAGMWQAHAGGVMPRDLSPCGDVLERDTALIFTHFERHYPCF
ncbi:MAG: hypothetical protein ABIO73_01905 [Polaromonas sp.]